MPSHPLSLRKTREAVHAAATDVQTQGGILDQHAKLLDAHSEALKAISAILSRPFFGRVKWILTGK